MIFLREGSEVKVMPYLLDMRWPEGRWPEGWTMVDKISAYQRRVIEYSYAYYHCDFHLVSDGKYDELCKYTRRLQEAFKEEAKKTIWWYVMHDFTGETGYYLFDRLNLKHQTWIGNGVDMKIEYLQDTCLNERGPRDRYSIKKGVFA